MSNLTLVIGNRNLSSWSLRGWLAARLSGLPFEEKFIELDVASTSAELDQWSPSRLVPVLIEDGQTIWDSLAILERLAELAPDAAIWPRDPRTRAQARSVVCEMHSGFRALRENCPMDITGSRSNFQPNTDVQADIDRITKVWTDCLESDAAQAGPYLFGQYSAADVFYTPVASRFTTYKIALPSRLEAYRKGLMEHPFMVDWSKSAALEPPTGVI